MSALYTTKVHAVGGRAVGRSMDRIGESILPKLAFGWAPARG